MYLFLLIVGSGPLKVMLIFSIGCVSLINLSCAILLQVALLNTKMGAYLQTSVE